MQCIVQLKPQADPVELLEMTVVGIEFNLDCQFKITFDAFIRFYKKEGKYNVLRTSSNQQDDGDPIIENLAALVCPIF